MLKVAILGREWLGQHKQLSILTLGRAGLTPAGMERLQSLLPECHVIVRDLSSRSGL